jgi:prepilin-type N-terminal cleavage/methylation domain-containing protein
VVEMKKGMTLIEVLVASLILIIGLTFLMMSFTRSQRINLENTHRFNATLIINRWFEDITNAEMEITLDTILDSVGESLEIKRKISDTYMQSYFLKLDKIKTVSPTDATDLTVINAIVSWKTAYGDRSMSMSMISNEPN